MEQTFILVFSSIINIDLSSIFKLFMLLFLNIIGLNVCFILLVFNKPYILSYGLLIIESIITLSTAIFLKLLIFESTYNFVLFILKIIYLNPLFTFFCISNNDGLLINSYDTLLFSNNNIAAFLSDILIIIIMIIILLKLRLVLLINFIFCKFYITFNTTYSGKV